MKFWFQKKRELKQKYFTTKNRYNCKKIEEQNMVKQIIQDSNRHVDTDEELHRVHNEVLQLSQELTSLKSRLGIS